MTHGAKVWTALVTVYVIWGSTYLGIAVTGETIPPLFAAATRFIAAGSLMVLVVLLRGGQVAGLAARARLVHPDRDPPAGRERGALLRGARRADRTGLADHRLRAALGRRPAPRGAGAAALAGPRRRRRRLCGRRRLAQPSGGATYWGNRALPALGDHVVGRLRPLGARDDARRSVRGDRVRDARGWARDAAALALHCARLLAVDRFDPRLALPGHVRLDRGLHGVRLAARERTARDWRRRTRTSTPWWRSRSEWRSAASS